MKTKSFLVSLLFTLLLFLASCTDTPTMPRMPADGVVLAFGDSITYGTGAGESQSYPKTLEGLIGRRVLNSGVPGETTAEGLARLPAVLCLMILCLGGNDFLRRLNEEQAEENLKAMVRAARERGVPVVLLGVPKPGLFLKTHQMYGEVAKGYAIPYEGKALQRILGENSLKSDHIHPNAAGYRQLAESVADLLKKAGAL